MDEKYLLATVRYVERNPLVAKLCRHTGEWAWSSATAHLNGIDDDLARVKPMLERISDWASYLMDGKEHGEAMELIERHANGEAAWERAISSNVRNNDGKVTYTQEARAKAEGQVEIGILSPEFPNLTL